MRPLVAIVGPTASGKTALALSLASALGGEVVGADSRQVYRYLDIGTGKPTPQQRAQRPHHLVDIVNPDEPFTLARYLGLARDALEDIWSRGRVPLLVGGTGLYVWSLLEGWQVPRVPPDAALRRELEARASQGERESLYQELECLDVVYARSIDPRNVRRVIRALEVCLTTGQPFSQLQHREPPGFSPLILGLTTARDELYGRIDARVDDMIKEGWVDEVRGLLGRGYSSGLPSLSGMGYRELAWHLEGRLGLPEAVARIKYRTHSFARHQYAWFRQDDRRILWLDITQDVLGQALRLAEVTARDKAGLGIR